MNIRELSKLIFTDKPIIVPKDRIYEAKMTEMTDGIFGNEKARDGRTYEQVYASVKKSVAEIALWLHNPDFIMNPKKHDKTNRHTYAYDNIYKPLGYKIEIKRWPDDQPTGDLAEWFSYPTKGLSTFRDNLHLIDYLVGAKTIEFQDHFEVYFLMIADAKTFFSYTKKGMYNDKDTVYYHKDAMRDGLCVKNTQVKYHGAKYVRTPFSASAA